jgi:tetratricopeptide (TPR) repeat protein
MSELAVPASLQRRASEVEGWLELGCPEIALDKVDPLLEVAGARNAGLFYRVRGNVELGRFSEALRDIEELRPVHHDREWLDLTEAWCCKRTGRLTDAIACMERLVRREPTSAVGHFNLGCYLALLGHQDLAMCSLTHACSLDDSFRGVPLDDADLASLRGRADFVALREAAEGHDAGAV